METGCFSILLLSAGGFIPRRWAATCPGLSPGILFTNNLILCELWIKNTNRYLHQKIRLNMVFLKLEMRRNQNVSNQSQQQKKFYDHCAERLSG